MDNPTINNQQMSVLDNIVQSVAKEVYDKWLTALPEDQKSDEMLQNLSRNSYDITIYVVQSFMDKFNAAAESLTKQD